MAEVRQRQQLGVRLSSGTGDALDRGIILGGLLACVGVLAGTMFMLDRANLDVWTGLLTFLVLVALSVPVFRWVARKDDLPQLFPILFGGFIAKLLSSLVRYFVIFVVYQGDGDAGRYHEAGAEFVRRFRDGLPIHPLPMLDGFPIESQRMGDLTGVMYLGTGTSAYAGFFLYSSLCFIGQLLFVRALRVAVPEANHLRYARIVIFLPSLLFWPSSIGKESVMIFCLGIIAYGGALLLAPKPRVVGIVFFALGTVLVMLFRPHIALMSLGALILATGVGAVVRGERVGGKGRSVRLAALVGLVLAIGVVSTAVGSLFEEDTESVALSSDGGPTGAAAHLDQTLKQTSIGNSEFAAPAVTSPIKLPWAVVSVLLRPFPWEARSVNSLIAASEGILLGYLFASSWRRLRVAPLLAARRPYVVFVAAYILVFSVAFSFVGNFGILARQRTQMLPAALVLLALPEALERRKGKVHTMNTLVPLERTAGTVERSDRLVHSPRLKVLTLPSSPQSNGAR